MIRKLLSGSITDRMMMTVIWPVGCRMAGRLAPAVGCRMVGGLAPAVGCRTAGESAPAVGCRTVGRLVPVDGCRMVGMPATVLIPALIQQTIPVIQVTPDLLPAVTAVVAAHEEGKPTTGSDFPGSL